jgi:hypothetical protein
MVEADKQFRASTVTSSYRLRVRKTTTGAFLFASHHLAGGQERPASPRLLVSE